MVLGGAFTALLLLISGVSAVNVQPPTGVTVSCTDLKVTVQWEYREQQPGTVFLVTLSSSSECARDKTKRTPDHQFDLTPSIWQSEECYMDYIHVSVKAEQGDGESEPADSSFSFNSLKTVDFHCKLDFPPVDLEQTESGSRVTFMNPLHFYKELREADKPDNAVFAFDVFTDYGNGRSKCTVTEEICKFDIDFHDSAEKCVTLEGKLFKGDGSGEVQFGNTTRICQSEPPEVQVMLLVILLSVAVVVISLLILLICKVKAWILTTPPLPDPLRLRHKEMQGLRYDLVRDSYISRARVAEPCRNPSISPVEENDSPLPPQDGSACSDVQPPADSYGTGNLSASSSQASAEERRLGDDDDDSVSTECVTIDSEEGAAAEEERSPYDCPHVLQVDIGDGEMVDAYTGK